MEANPALTTPSPAATPAATTDAPKSIVGDAAAPAWAEYVPDTAKSADENAAAKTAHDATKPAPVAEAAPTFTPIDFAKDVKLPEGVVVDENVSKEFTAIVNDPKLSRAEMAQKLVDLQIKNAGDASTKLSETGKQNWETLQTDWQKLCQTDPDIGGDKLPVAEQNIGRLLDTFGTPALRAVFDLTGAGNHPEMVKFMNKVQVKLDEYKEPSPPPPPNAGSTDQSLAARMFSKP